MGAFGKRSELEEVWARYRVWVILRPRYLPDWSLPPEMTSQKCESAILLRTWVNPSFLVIFYKLNIIQGRVLDAMRILDGAKVALKFVGTVSPDTEVSGYLTTEPGAQNHCLPMLELLQLEDSGSCWIPNNRWV